MTLFDEPEIVLAPDSVGSEQELWTRLSPAERACAREHATASRRRQFALARLCAKTALRHALGVDRVEILTGPRGEPLPFASGQKLDLVLSLTHSARLAAACVWSSGSGQTYSAGIDLEQVRETDVSENEYAFSERERDLIGNTRGDRGAVGLAAWAVKEAAWKALIPGPNIGPESVEVMQLDLEQGLARVQVSESFRELLGNHLFQVSVGFVEGPDGPYILTFASTCPDLSQASEETANSGPQARNDRRLPGIQKWSSVCRIKTRMIAASS